MTVGSAQRAEVVVVGLGGLGSATAWQLARQPDERKARSTFSYSMLYLALLFAALAVDAVV